MTLELPKRTEIDRPVPGDPVARAEELIIKEARQRHRRRLVAITGIVVVAIAGMAIAVLSLVGHGPTPKPVSTLPTFSRQPQPTAAAMCQNGQVNVTSLSSGAGTGNVYQVLGFVNVSRSSCTLTGYPQVAALDAHGDQVALGEPLPPGPESPWVTGVTTPPSVTLKPGQTASAIIQGTEVPVAGATTCPSYPTFLVTPPNQTESITVPSRQGSGPGAFPGCSPIKVNPVVPGTTGSLPAPANVYVPPPRPGSRVPTTVPSLGGSAPTTTP